MLLLYTAIIPVYALAYLNLNLKQTLMLVFETLLKMIYSTFLINQNYRYLGIEKLTQLR